METESLHLESLVSGKKSTFSKAEQLHGENLIWKYLKELLLVQIINLCIKR